MTDAIARLATLHHEMRELEAKIRQKHAEPQEQAAQAEKLERLREQRVRRPRLLFSFSVSSQSGQGLDKLRRGLAALMRDRRLFPHVGMRVPLNYSMLERLTQEGRAQEEQEEDKDGADGDAEASETSTQDRADWEQEVTKHVARNASPGLRKVCGQAYASLDELGRLAEPPMTKDAVAGRIRRLLATADRRAADLGIPDTESVIADLLEE